MHPPNSDWSFYRQRFDILTSEAEGVLICGGDLNVRLNDKLDSSGASTGQTKINKKINTVMREVGIIDVWRDLHPTVRDYTHLPHPHSVYTRIDYFLMYNTDRHRITHCEIGNIDISDHSPLYLTIDLNRNAKCTFWKLNSSILNSPLVKEELGEEIQTYFDLNDTGDLGPSMLWDTFRQ